MDTSKRPPVRSNGIICFHDSSLKQFAKDDFDPHFGHVVGFVQSKRKGGISPETDKERWASESSVGSYA